MIKKIWGIKNSKTSRSAFFQNAQRDVLGFFKIYHFLIGFEKKKGIIFSTWPNLSHGWTLTGCKNWSWTSLSMFFLMKIIALTIQMRRTSQKLVAQNISRWKETLSQKLGFSKNLTALTLLSKVPPCTIIVVQDRFFNLTIWKPMA